MPLVDHQLASSNPVSELVSQNLSSLNQPIYLRLRLALSLNLRRQIFIAVCDDVRLRDRFAAKLQTDLETSPLNFGVEESKAKHAASGNPAMNGKADKAPKLVTLNLSLSNPNVLEQIQHWRSTNPRRIKSAFDPVISFQIVGIEQLTRQPVYLQHDFLNSLQALAHQFTTVDFNLVLWVSRPWCRSILQSVPEFWQWHTGVFEFEGDPTPVAEAKRISPVVQPPAPLIVQSSAPPVVQPPPPVVQSPDPFIVSPPVPSVVQPPASQPAISEPATASKPAAYVDLIDLVLSAVEQDMAASEANSPQDVERFREPLRILQHLETLHLEQASAATLSSTYQQLGDFYRERVEQGNSSTEVLTIAIGAYEQVLSLSEPNAPELADLLNDIGNLYWLLSRHSEDRALPNLENAIRAYQLALDKLDPETRSQTYAMIQNNLGSAYSDRAYRKDPTDNFQQAINAYQKVLMYRSATDDSSRYAATQNNLGTAFWNLAQYKTPILNFQSAIAAYIEALHHYDPEQEPLHYGMIQNNLGTAYWNLSQCPRSHDPSEQLNATPEDFLMLAIAAYRIALIYRTLEATPAAHAATQNNLGTAYWHLANLSSTHYEDRSQYLQSAIAAYQASIAIAHSLVKDSPSSLTFDVWAAHNNLGSAYHQLATDNRGGLDTETRSQCLEASIFHHVQAVQGWQENPDFYDRALAHLVQTVKTLHDRQGIQGQTLAFSKIPAWLIPTVMKQL